MSPAEFEALRARGLRVLSITKAKAVQPAKARSAVKRKASARATAEPTATAYIHPVHPGMGATDLQRVDPKRVMALDLSTAKTGMAWGYPGDKPLGTALLATAPETALLPEGRALLAHARTIVEAVLEHGCGFVIFSEFYNARTMLAFRANSSLRGAVMAQLAAHGIDALPVAEITARKAAGVDLSRPADKEHPKGYMKARARTRLEQLDLGYLSEDEGDAAILLYGATAVVEIGNPPSTTQAAV